MPIQGVDELLAPKLGGFNWSSQHPDLEVRTHDAAGHLAHLGTAGGPPGDGVVDRRNGRPGR
jgi:hypothetical protein